MSLLRSLLLILVGLVAGAVTQANEAAASAPSGPPLVFLGDRHLAPYEFESGGAPTGSNVDIALAIGRVLGRPVEVRLDDWSRAQQRFRDGEGDALMPLGRTPEREQWLSFTRPAVTHSYSLFVRTDDIAPLDPNRLEGVRIAVAAGGLPAQKLAREHPEAQLQGVDNLDVATRRLLAREVDALAAPTAPQLYLLQQRGLRGITQLPPFHTDRVGFGVRPGDAPTLAALNVALDKLEDDGELDRIDDRWTRERVFLFSGFTVRMGQVAAVIALLSLLGLAGATLMMVRQRRRLRVEVIERREAETQALRSEERTGRLQRMTAALSATVTPEDVAQVVAENSHQAVTAPFVWVAELVDRGRHWHTLAYAGYDPQLFETYGRFAITDDLPIREALQRRTPQYLGNRAEAIAAHPSWRDLLNSLPHESLYVSALTSGRAQGEQVVGALALAWPEPREFDAVTLDQLASLSALVAQALERTQLRRAERRAAQRQSTLKDVAAALNGANGLPEICAIVCEAGLEALSASHAVVASFDEAGGVEGAEGTAPPLRMAYLSAGAEEGFARWKFDAQSLLARVAEQRRGVFADDPAALLELLGPPAGSDPDDAPCAVAALPLMAPTEEGAPVGVLAFWFARECDLSDEVQAFVSALADLTARAIDRCRLLEQLRDSLAASTVADRRKDEFLAMLGHELRNPLSPIVSAVELLARAGDRAAVREQTVDVIRRQVRQMIRLVDELLEMSRIRHGLIELQIGRVDVAALAREALESVRAVAEDKSLELVAHAPEAPLWIDADGGRLQQVAINLLTNAVRYTPEGGRVEIEVARDGDAVQLAVRDNGIGIEPEFLPRVFELFTQGSPGGGRRAGSGLGLGLALVKQLVQLHGGSVEARSEGTGRGATFVVRLPAGGA